jgi:hypothetical protein
MNSHTVSCTGLAVNLCLRWQTFNTPLIIWFTSLTCLKLVNWSWISARDYCHHTISMFSTSILVPCKFRRPILWFSVHSNLFDISGTFLFRKASSRSALYFHYKLTVTSIRQLRSMFNFAFGMKARHSRFSSDQCYIFCLAWPACDTVSW